MYGASGNQPARLLLDAGPLIALLHASDPDHASAVRGFQQLLQARTRLTAPLPIVFEVYKWLLFEADSRAARLGFARMRQGLEILSPSANALDELADILEAMPTWGGTLEDALVALCGLKLDVPVWTLNYRDLSAFRKLQFWSPT